MHQKEYCVIDVAPEENGLTWIRLEGRIDSITAPDVEKCLNELISSGQRTLALDMQSVHYMSSMGLRVLLAALKQLKKADGELLICKPPAFVQELFDMSGFQTLFRIFPDRESLESERAGAVRSEPSERIDIGGIVMLCIRRPVDPGRLRVIGRSEKLAGSRYEEPDVLTVKADEIQYGLGLATLGDAFDEYKSFFGEAVVLNHSLFFYPAVKRPAVDLMLCPRIPSTISYRFLHGFSFSGAFSRVIAFESTDHPVELERLVQALGEMVPGNVFAMVWIAESKGVWGMHLKQVPLMENRPANGKDIFDADNFATWMNFPVEPADMHHILAGAGLVAKHPEREPQPIRELFAAGSRVHSHAAMWNGFRTAPCVPWGTIMLPAASRRPIWWIESSMENIPKPFPSKNTRA